MTEHRHDATTRPHCDEGWHTAECKDDILAGHCDDCGARLPNTPTLQCRARDWPGEEELYREVAAVKSTPISGPDRRDLRDDTALAIAAMWQAPGTPGDGNGAALAALASGVRVRLEYVLSDALAASDKATTTERDKDALVCLCMWASALATRQRKAEVGAEQYGA